MCNHLVLNVHSIPYHPRDRTMWRVKMLPMDPHLNRNKRKFSRFVHEGFFLSTPFLWVELTSWLTLFRLLSRKFLVVGSFLLDCGCDGRVILRDEALQIGSKNAYPLSGSSVQWGWLQGLCYSDLAFSKGFSLWYRLLCPNLHFILSTCVHDQTRCEYCPSNWCLMRWYFIRLGDALRLACQCWFSLLYSLRFDKSRYYPVLYAPNSYWEVKRP
jgi:hypothetical protein